MHTITLTTVPQAKAALERLGTWVLGRVENGRPVRLAVSEAKRTLAQNDLMQKLVRSIGKKLERTDHDETRALLVELWRHETGRQQTHVKSLDGLRWVDLSNRTSGMDVPTESEFIDWLQAKEAEL